MKANTVSLSDVCEINPSTDCKFQAESPCTFVPMEAVDDWSARITSYAMRPFREVSKGYTKFAENDVLLAKITPCMENGKCALARGLREGVGFGTTEFHILRASELVLPEWLYHFWRFPKTRQCAERAMTGSAGQKRVPSSYLETLEVPLPNLSEQKRITKLLEQADHLRRIRRYALELSGTFLPAAFLKIFGNPECQQSKWPIEPLGDQLEAIEGGVNFNPIEENQTASAWRVLKVSAVSTGEFLPDESKPILPSEKFSDKLFVKIGDLIMSRANTSELVGAVARVRVAPPKVLLPDKLWRLKFASNSKILPDYALFALRTRPIRREIEIRATGTSGSMKNISQGDAAELRIPIPSLSLQIRFAELVERHELLRAKQREALRQAEHLFQTLLHQAFTIEGTNQNAPSAK